MTHSAKNLLTNHRVLLIGIGFYDYESAIADELIRQGAAVEVYDELPTILRNGLIASLFRRSKINVQKIIDWHQEKILEEVSTRLFSHIIIIKGENISVRFINNLKRKNPGVQLIAYHWDSMSRFPHLVKRHSLFDKVFTFDPVDARRYEKMQFLPLFYRPSLESGSAPELKSKYDILFVGWLHHERLLQVKTVFREARTQGLSMYCYLYTGLFSRILLTLIGRGHFLKSVALVYPNYLKLIRSSKSILDLPHPNQVGLSMRAVEAIGACKKLITTSRDIVSYDFYHPNNIMVIDLKGDFDLSAFLSAPIVSLPQSTIDKYSISFWVTELLGVSTDGNMDRLPAK